MKSRAPLYGDNYKIGYIGFTFHDRSILSRGIAYFTRWSRMSDIRVSHALIVTGNGRCVEAVKSEGVSEQPIDKYFDNPHMQIFFRKPRLYSEKLGERIAKTAAGQVGARYDKLLIAAQMLQGSFLGRWVHAVFGDHPDEFVSRVLNADDRWICSELAAYVLDSQPEYRDKGILAKPDFTIDPQELFEDDLLFCKWHRN